jgi:hypothetical protein
MPWPLLIVTLTACGGADGVSGVYEVQGQGLWDRFDFQDGNKVAVGVLGQTKIGEYTVMDDGRIRVMLEGSVLTLKDYGDGCLAPTAGDAAEAQRLRNWGASPDDLAELGRYCRSGASRGSSQVAGAPSGRYRSTFGDNGIALDFLRDGNVDVTIIEGSHQETERTSYVMSGDQILISIPDGPNMTLNRRGGGLETTMDGITMRFEEL